MAATRTLTGNVFDLARVPLGADDVRVSVVTNLDSNEALIDRTTKGIHLGGRPADLNSATGEFTIGLIDTSASDLNVVGGDLQYQALITFIDPATQTREVWASGWFSLTANRNLADIATDVSPMAVQSASVFATQSRSFRDEAFTAKRAVEERVVEDLGTTDAQTKALMQNSASQTSGALFAAISGALSGVEMSLTSTAGLQARAENALTYQNTPTYDGSGQAVHPCVVYVPGGWNGWRYWMAFTPYPNSSAAQENPSILVSQDGDNWQVPAGLTNPVINQPSGGYNSDTELLIIGSKMYMIYRTTVDSANLDQLRVIESTNGVTWTNDRLVLAGPNGGAGSRVSPTLVYDQAASLWRMWVNTNITGNDNNLIRLFTSSSLTGPWTDQGACTGIVSPTGFEPWHLHVHRDGDEFVMFVNVAPNGQTTAGTLHRAVSRDGMSWVTDPKATLWGNNSTTGGTAVKWDAGLYRSCAIPASVKGRKGYALWYSAYQGSMGWHIGRTFVELINPETQALNTLSAAGGAAPWIAGDLVDRADSTTSPGTMTSGMPWTIASGTWGVIGRQLYSPTTAGLLTCDAGTADVDVRVRVTNTPNFGAILFRAGATATTSWWTFGNNGTAANGYRLQKYDGTTVTTIGTRGFLVAAGDELRVVAKGDRIRCWVNDILLWDITDSFNQTATKVGLKSDGTVTRFKGFAVRPA